MNFSLLFLTIAAAAFTDGQAIDAKVSLGNPDEIGETPDAVYKTLAMWKDTISTECSVGLEWDMVHHDDLEKIIMTFQGTDGISSSDALTKLQSCEIQSQDFPVIEYAVHDATAVEKLAGDKLEKESMTITMNQNYDDLVTEWTAKSGEIQTALGALFTDKVVTDIRKVNETEIEVDVIPQNYNGSLKPIYDAIHDDSNYVNTILSVKNKTIHSTTSTSTTAKPQTPQGAGQDAATAANGAAGNDNKGEGLSNGAKGGIAAGGAIVVIAAISGGYYAYGRNKKQKDIIEVTQTPRVTESALSPTGHLDQLRARSPAQRGFSNNGDFGMN